MVGGGREGGEESVEEGREKEGMGRKTCEVEEEYKYIQTKKRN